MNPQYEILKNGERFAYTREPDASIWQAGCRKDSLQAGAVLPFSQFWADRNDNEALHRIALLGQSEWRLVAPLFSYWLRRLGCPEAAHQWDQTGLSFQLQEALLDQWKKVGHPQISWPESDVEYSWEVVA